MAVGDLMGGENKKLIFHDFLAMSRGNVPATLISDAPEEAETSPSAGISSIGHGLILGSGDLVSGSQTMSNSEVFLVRGRKNESSLGPETFAGRKRCNSDDKIRSVCEDTLECSRSSKEKYRKDEIQFQMKPPLWPTPLSSRPILLPSKWEQQTILTNSGSAGQFSYVSKDITQPPQDEGSRTGIKGSGVMNSISSSRGADERNLASILPYSSKINEPESSKALRCHGRQNVGRQMTIFYAGQAHVFDDVHPNKAEVIMALAGSSGGDSLSTTYLHKNAMFPATGQVKVGSEDYMQMQNTQTGRTSLSMNIRSSITLGGDQQSVRDGSAAIQPPLLSPERKRDAS